MENQNISDPSVAREKPPRKPIAFEQVDNSSPDDATVSETLLSPELSDLTAAVAAASPFLEPEVLPEASTVTEFELPVLPRDPSVETTSMQSVSTKEDTTASGGRISASHRQLLDNYRSILHSRCIYHPVAYRFLKELGRGRQGIVYLGLRQGARGCITRHAIKIFDPGLYSCTEKYWTDMGRIAAQTSKLQLIKNPSLVAPDIYEEAKGIGYLQMEVVDGISLRDLMDGAHLAQVRARSTEEEWQRFNDVIFRQEGDRLLIQPGIALYILRQVLRGLETLHEMGFIHSDIKPANIMIDRLGYVKLIDYGRATLVNEKITILMGTPAYMAPETHQRQEARVQSDFYSLGMVALEMLRGARLFPLHEVPDESELLLVKNGLPNKLYSLLPEHVRQNAQFLILLQRFLEPDPQNRYATAEEAEVGQLGLATVHKQLAMAGKDTEYGRELENYLSKIVNPLGPM